MRKALGHTVLLALLLALAVVALGAYTRLQDAGLGCPDWPGCYGSWGVPSAAANDTIARDWGAAPDRDRAAIEMAHRYLAATLGALIVAIAMLLWRARRRPDTPWRLGLALLALVIAQGVFGMWTVTLRLWPQVVTVHLLGGLATVAGLWWLWLRLARPQTRGSPSRAALPVGLGVALLVGQIALGGWTSANYAAHACPDLPTCQGRWWPDMDPVEGFDLTRPPEAADHGGARQLAGRTAIHVVHRVGALLVTAYWLVLALTLRRTAAGRHAALMIALLGGQLALGATNVLLHWPWPLALGHHLVAVGLLLTALTLWRATRTDRLEHT